MTKRVWQITNRTIGMVYESERLLSALKAAFSEECRTTTDTITAKYTEKDFINESFKEVLFKLGKKDVSFNKGSVLNLIMEVIRLQITCKPHMTLYYQSILNDLEEIYKLFDVYDLQTVTQVK